MKIENNKIENLTVNLLNKYGVCPRNYSFGCYSEERFCIEKDGTQWIVYVGERGRKENVQSFSSPVRAYRYLIDRATLIEPNHDAILQDYDSEITTKNVEDNRQSPDKRIACSSRPSSWRHRGYVYKSKKEHPEFIRLKTNHDSSVKVAAFEGHFPSNISLKLEADPKYRRRSNENRRESSNKTKIKGQKN